MLRIFTPVKIQWLRPGLKPRTWVPEASMLTTRPPKPFNFVYYRVTFFVYINTFTAIVNLSGFNNSCLKSPASTLVDLTFQSRALRSFSLNQLRNLSL